MPESDARNGAVPNDLFGSLPTARSPLADLHARSAPAPGSRRALREAAERDAAAREAVARHAAERHGVATPPVEAAPAQPAEPAPGAPVSGVRTAAHDAGIAALMAPSTATWPVPVQTASAPATPPVPSTPGVAEERMPVAEPAVTPRPAAAAPEPLPADGADAEAQMPEQSSAEQSRTEQPTPESPATEEDDDPGSFHALFAPEHHKDVPKKKRGRGCLIGVIIMLGILGGIAAGGARVWSQYGDKHSDVMGWGEPKDYDAGLATGEALVTIKSGDTGSPVSTALYEAGVTKTDRVFYEYLLAENPSATFYPGIYKLQKKMTAAAALEALQDPATRMENTARVPEGDQIKNFLPTVAESLEMPLAELEAAVANPADYGVQAKTLEGWLFPAVYTFDPGVTAKEAIQQMVDRTRKSLKDAGVAAGDEERILTIASIVQREGHTADFDKVARVIDNRLQPSNSETHGLLQMDSTAQYGYGLTHDGAVSSWPWKEVVADQNAWNTYVHAGLPASPISTPSDAAINAAQNPAEGPWYYFVTVNLDTGETVFSATYKEQQAAEAEYKQWCKDNPDGGCY